jgi:putative aldouronate transport system permease protein
MAKNSAMIPFFSNQIATGTGRKKSFLEKLILQKQLIFMSVPMLIYIIIFAYIPVVGWVMAFQQFKPAKSIFNQKWVGFEHFKFLFKDINFYVDLRNTLSMSLINLVLGFTAAITLALLLNEVRNITCKRIVQTVSYLPHFLSWVIVTSIVASCLATDGGIVNIVLEKLGIIDSPVTWLNEGKYFWGIVSITNVWKEVGWNTIIFLAAMASIDPALYEAAEIDGANRYHKMWYVTLPGIKATFMVLLIMNIGSMMDAGFEMQYLLRNGLNMDFSETIDIYVLKYGIEQSNFSLATAAGIFRSTVSIAMLVMANSIASRIGEEKLF